MSGSKYRRNRHIAQRVLIDRVHVAAVARELGVTTTTADKALRVHCRQADPVLYGKLCFPNRNPNSPWYGDLMPPSLKDLRKHADTFAGDRRSGNREQP